MISPGKLAGLLGLLVCIGCAHRTNPNDPESVRYVPAVSETSDREIDSVRVYPDTVCAGDSVTLTLHIHYSGGDSTLLTTTYLFQRPVDYLVLATDSTDAATSTLVHVISCD